MKLKRITAVIKKSMAVLSSFFVLSALVSCSENSENSFFKSDFVMDTTLTQTVYCKRAQDITDEVFTLLKERENVVSAFIDNSEISKINSSKGKSTRVSKQTFDIIKKSLDYCRKSDGVFDITVFPLSSIWKSAIKQNKLPQSSEIDTALRLVDFTRVKLNEENLSVTLPENMGIDLGAVYKGAVLNEVYNIYEKNGVSGAICSLGNSAMLIFKNKGGKPFKIGLRNPFENAQNELFAHISLENCIVSTSGGYERYTEIEGEKYHHIIDLKTGYSAKSSVVSATVIGSDGAECDYLSTRLFLLGFEKAKEVCKNENISAVLVSEQKEVFVSAELLEKTEITNKDFERIS